MVKCTKAHPPLSPVPRVNSSAHLLPSYKHSKPADSSLMISTPLFSLLRSKHCSLPKQKSRKVRLDPCKSLRPCLPAFHWRHLIKMWNFSPPPKQPRFLKRKLWAEVEAGGLSQKDGGNLQGAFEATLQCTDSQEWHQCQVWQTALASILTWSGRWFPISELTHTSDPKKSPNKGRQPPKRNAGNS